MSQLEAELARRPIPPASALAALLWALFSGVAYSNAGSDVVTFLFGAAAALLWMLVWIARLGARLWRARGTPFEVSRARILYWAFEPSALAIVVLLSAGGVFAKARFLASERALTEYAEGVRSGAIAPQDGGPARSVGLYRVSSTQRLEGGAVRFITAGEGLLDAAGFAHSPGGPPPRLGEDSYRPFHEAWFLWRQSW